MTSVERRAPAPLALEFLFGRGFVVLCNPLTLGAATLHDCKLEVPELRGLVDIGGSLSRFRRTRTRLYEAATTVHLAGIGFGPEPEDDVALGLFVDQGRLWLVAEARQEESGDTQFAAELVMGPAESGVVQVVATELVAFGDVGGPACTALQRIIAARLSTLEPAIVRTMQSRPSAVRWDVGRWVGLCTVAARGWKLPGRGLLGPLQLVLGDDSVTVRVGAELKDLDPRAAKIGAATESADDALEAGDVDGAIRALREASVIHGQDRLRAARLADLLIASGRPEHVTEATGLPLSSVQRASLECRVAVMARDGAALVQALARAVDAADTAQHRGAAVAARIALARQLAFRNDNQALSKVREAAAIAPRHPVVRRAELGVPRLLDDASSVDTTARVRRLAERAAIQSGDYPRVVEFGDAADEQWDANAGDERWSAHGAHERPSANSTHERWDASERERGSAVAAVAAAGSDVASAPGLARGARDTGAMATRDLQVVPEDRTAQHKALLAKARAGGDEREIAAALAALAEVTRSPTEAAALFAEAGSLYYYDLEEEPAALRALEQARALDPSGAGADYAVLSALESLYEETNDAEGLLRIYDAKLAQTQEPEVRRVFQLTMASVLLGPLARPDRALELCDEVVRDDSRNVPGRRTRSKALEALKRVHDAAAELDTILAMPELDEIERHDILRDAARLWSGVDGAIAETRFEEILQSFPADTEALGALKRLRGARGDWDAYTAGLGYELGVLLGHGEPSRVQIERIKVADVPAPLRTTAASIIAEAADVALRQRGHSAAAIDYLQISLRLSPDDPTLWEALAEAARDAGDDSTLADALEALIPHLLDPATREATIEEAEAARRRVSSPTAPTESDPAEQLAALVLRANSGEAQAAVNAIDQWLPEVRDASLRRTLLLKKATWLTRLLGAPAAGLLPLKGALILAPDSIETRCVLLETYAAMGRASGAQDQMREIVSLLASSPPDDQVANEVASTFARWCASSSPPRDLSISAWLDVGAEAWRPHLEDALLHVR